MSTFFYVPQYFTTQLSVAGGIDDTQTTGIVLQDISGIDHTKPGIIALTWSNPIDTTKIEYIFYTSINDSTKELVGVTRGQEGYSAKSHLNGATVAWPLSKSHINNIPDSTTTFTNKTMDYGDNTFTNFPTGILSTTSYAPRGFLINGKIVPSVASNNLTVSLKGLDGNDPSASNIVYVRIGDTIHSITSALSVTKNAGTNWCNAGGTELATQEVDYFVYLGYNATDGVVIGFSRIPYATEYDSFSATSTASTYCAISTITNVAAGDDYELVGRFAATLSAGAGYTWTVPTFTNKNLIQRPIFETRTLQYQPSYTGFSSNPSGTLNYRVVGERVYIDKDYLPGTSNATDFTFSLPFTVSISLSYVSAIGVRDNGSDSAGNWNVSSTTCTLGKALVTGNFTNSGVKGWLGLKIDFKI